jgi:hypothetical protein
MYSISSAVLLLFTQKGLKARGLTLIGGLISLAKGELSCKPLPIPAAGIKKQETPKKKFTREVYNIL